jgi:hypothetical protein
MLPTQVCPTTPGSLSLRVESRRKGGPCYYRWRLCQQCAPSRGRLCHRLPCIACIPVVAIGGPQKIYGQLSAHSPDRNKGRSPALPCAMILAALFVGNNRAPRLPSPGPGVWAPTLQNYNPQNYYLPPCTAIITRSRAPPSGLGARLEAVNDGAATHIRTRTRTRVQKTVSSLVLGTICHDHRFSQSFSDPFSQVLKLTVSSLSLSPLLPPSLSLPLSLPV